MAVTTKTHHDGPIIAERDNLQVIDCQQCRFRHLAQLPDPSVVSLFYGADQFYAQGPVGWLDKEVKEHQQGLWDSAYHWQVRHMGESPLVVDIGCSTGGFLKYWMDRSPSHIAWGIEPSESARSLSPVSNYIYKDWSSLTDLLLRLLSPPDMMPHLDRYTHTSLRAALVLEHIYDPYNFLVDLRYRLDPDGALCLIVPSEFNPLQQKLKTNHYVSHYHINYWTPGSLRKLLSRCGFKVIHESATFPMELFILAGLDYRNNDALGTRLHYMRLGFERAFGDLAWRMYQLLYRKLGMGRELIFIVKLA